MGVEDVKLRLTHLRDVALEDRARLLAEAEKAAAMAEAYEAALEVVVYETREG